VNSVADEDVVATLTQAGVTRGERVALAVTASSVALAARGRTWTYTTAATADVLAGIESGLRPRWTWWDSRTPAILTAAGLRVSACWDIAAVHRLLFGGWRTDPGDSWAAAHGLDRDSRPATGQLDLLGAIGDDGGDQSDPVQPDGYLRPGWVSGGWSRDPTRMAAWATAAAATADRQHQQLVALGAGGDAVLTAWSESATEMLCTELRADGLPIERATVEAIIADAAGPRPRSETDADDARSARDAIVLARAPGSGPLDLRNPAQVKATLVAVGVDLPDTRSWRLEPLRTTHPFIDALLVWRKAERVATTYGYSWLDANVGADGRLRGNWTGTDGAAGRMTAQAGLHNLPAELRPGVRAEAGHAFVRADLGQVEPRVLAVVSGDGALADAGAQDDLYAPVAARLGVERPVAKVAVLAAMYGQTSGAAGQALRGLQQAYPVAMAYLDAAYEDGRAGRAVRTYGGRLVRMPALGAHLDEAGVRAAQGSRGRYARNALVQGAAAEFFKIWTVTVRARLAATQARIVLCLHDELLVHAPAARADEVAEILRRCLAESAGRWQAGRSAVRFVADVSIVDRWSEAK
jgi:DNA polymerase-1